MRKKQHEAIYFDGFNIPLGFVIGRKKRKRNGSMQSGLRIEISCEAGVGPEHLGLGAG